MLVHNIVKLLDSFDLYEMTVMLPRRVSEILTCIHTFHFALTFHKETNILGGRLVEGSTSYSAS